MMNVLLTGCRSVPPTKRRFYVEAVLLLLIGAAVYGVSRSINYRQLIVSCVAIGAVAVVLAGSQGIYWGFLLWICSLGIGYRTITVSDELTVHPTEPILWSLLAWLAIWVFLQRGSAKAFWLPRWLWIFMPFWIWGWIVGLESGFTWTQMFTELRNFLLLVPLFVVVHAVLVSSERWRQAALVFYATGTWVACLGLTEYIFPGIRTLLPGLVTSPALMPGADGFARGSFSFWGSPAATYVCMLASPMAIPIWYWWPSATSRCATLVSAVLQIAAIYVGGFRIMWLLLAIELLLFLCIKRRYGLTCLSVAGFVLGYPVLPESTRQRIDSLWMLLRGTPVETSGVKHLARPLEALSSAFASPLGSGWSAAGWVHCDFIQVAANLGLLAGLLYFGAFAASWIRLAIRVRDGCSVDKAVNLRCALLLSLTAAGGIMTTQAVGVLPQLASPVWLVWVLVEICLRQSRKERVSFKVDASDLRLAAYL